MSATASSPAFLRYASPVTAPAAQIDIVVPVHNEAAALELSLRRLHRFLSAEFPFSWRIVVADNASTDATPEIAARLARELPGVEHLELERKGRGRALREAWSREPGAGRLLHGRRPLDRPARAAPARRAAAVGPLRPRDRDAPRARRRASCAAPSASSSRAPTTASCTRRCGRASPTPSAASRPSAATCSTTCSPRSATTAGSSTPSCSCSPSARGLRIHEVPVDWVDDPDSRVRPRAHGGRRPQGRRAAARRLADRPLRRRRRGSARSPTRSCSCCCAARLGAGAANAVALAITAVGNTAANRWLTFGVRGRTRPGAPARAGRRSSSSSRSA